MRTNNLIDPISSAEFETRRQSLAQRLKGTGFAGAVAFARQGTASTRAGYAIYLSNYYTPFFDGLEDCAPHWAGLGHAAVVVTASGDALLVTDMDHYYFPAEGPAHARIGVVHDTNVMRGVSKAFQTLEITKGKVALIGEEILSVKRFELLKSLNPALALTWNDTLLDDAMMIKSESELRILRHANRIVEEIAEEALTRAKPGATEHDLASFVRRSIAEAGGELFWMRPCGLNSLAHGDIYYMSIVAWFHGYFVDVARNCVVGSASAEKRSLVNYLNEYILGQAEHLRPGITAEQAAEYGYRYFLNPKSKLTREEIEEGALCPFPAFGHGIGLSFGKPYIREGDKAVLQPRMVIAIEANYEIPGVGVAEAEVTVEIGEDGPKLLSGLGARTT
ncbi:MAG: M24 family metallopeptidase [Rhodomicrobium sp.]